MTRKVKPLIHLEQLEPRILLSGDSLLNIAHNPDQDTVLDNPLKVVQEAELLHINEQVEEQTSQELTPSDTSNAEVYKPIFTLLVDDNNTNDESINADLSVDNIGSAQVNADIAVLLDDSDGDIESKVDTTEDDRQPVNVSDNDISIEETTPIEIRGPPATETVTLSGMHLVDPAADHFDGQCVYLDFDGGEDVTYNGPVVIEGINVPVFSAPDHLAGKEQAIIIEVLEELNEIFAGSGVVFTTEKPEHGASYSTIYVGGDDSAFAEYGSFLGLAEQVDIGNQNTYDLGFVFSDNIGSDFGITVSYSAELSHVIAHEIGHLLGYAHNNNHADSGILSAVANGVTFGSQQVISDQADAAYSVYACDLDGDGDNDILSASLSDDKIAWYENLGEGSFSAQQVISTQADGAHWVYACDLDGDGDNDVISASVYDDKIAWYENRLNEPTTDFGSQQVISTQADQAASVYACDLDGDGDNDVLSASIEDDKIAWYENLGGGTFGIQKVIGTAVDYAASVYACDLDGDGDNDVLSTSRYNDRIAWYANDGSGTFGGKQSISTDANGAMSVYACDLDGDGDNDVLSASWYDGKIAWYENDGEGTFGSQLVISTQADGTYSVYACDLDGDGDNDVLSASYNDDKIAWYENDGGGTFGSQQVISTQANGAFSVYACDLDGDGDNDVLSASILDDKIAWYENLGPDGEDLAEIEVIGNSQVILDGDTTPSLSDHTDFGSVYVASGSVTRTFTIRNVGSEDLNLTGSPDRVVFTGSSDFVVTQQPTSPVVANGGTTTFEITFDPSSYEIKTAIISIANDDNNEDPYDFVIQGKGSLFGSQQVISNQTDGAISVYSCDLDGDGDNDVLSASYADDKIAWYENLGGGIFSTQQIISTQAEGAESVYACDLDGDGDNDVLSASSVDGKIACYENLGGGKFDAQQVISTLVSLAKSIYACDLDGDGDKDVISASALNDKIAWYENDGEGTFGSQQVISTQADGAWSVYACDLDGDGDNDVLSASNYDNKIAWYENDGEGTFGSQHVISTQADGAYSVYACDLDGDSDNDVLSASAYDDKIAWYENLGGGNFSTQQVISTQANGPWSVYACDLDGDNDNDVLSASYLDDKVAWYENLGGGAFGTQQVINTQAKWEASVYACDLDGDGDNDVLSASYWDDTIAWYENLRSPGVGSPEIDVERNGTDDVHAHSFGTLEVGQSASQDFMVRNEGDDDLVVFQAGGLVSPFSISPLNSGDSNDDWVIPPSGIQTFTVSFFPVNPGNYSDTLVLTSNDSDEGSYQIDFTASAISPEIEILGNNQVILDGDTTPSLSDHTDFDNAYVPSGSITRTFTIRNVGSKELNLTGSPDRVVITGSGDFVVTQQPSSPLAAYGGTTYFEVTFDPSSYGTKTAIVSIANDDNNEDPYDFVVQGAGSLFGSQQVISTQMNGTTSIYGCDLDGDGDNDALSASRIDDKIAWYENLGGGAFSTQHVISTQVEYANTVYSCDLDGDGDNDVVAAYDSDGMILWYENLGGGNFGDQQVINTQVDYVMSVYACDLDSDGDNDVLSGSYSKVAWYENLGGGTFGTQHIIKAQNAWAESVYACDLDSDGDNDILYAPGSTYAIPWYENLGGGTFGARHEIGTQELGVSSVYACDLDADGDNDVISASDYSDNIAWYENLGNSTFGTQQIISAQADGAVSVYACDLDGDGDNDVLSASENDDKIAWYENRLNEPTADFGSQHVISTQANQAVSVYACDLDGDGDNDVLSGSWLDDKIAWYENLGSPGVGSPEIDIERDGTDDVHAHSFGTLEVGQSASQEFMVRNEGDAVLVVTQAAGLVSPFSINPLNSSGSTDDWLIPAGGIQTFTVSFSPVSAGDYSDTLILTSNDSDEGSYQISFAGRAEGTEIEVLGNSQVILDGDSTPGPGDHTDFGIAPKGATVVRTFTIMNVGSEDLNLTGSPDRVVITGNTDFTVTQQPASPVAAYGGTTTFEITFDPSSYGTKTATISIANNDNDENPYDFVIQGTCALFDIQQVISTSAQAVERRSVYACDLDGDGDNDVLSASVGDNEIAWCENLGGGTFSSEQVISTQADGPISIYACDLDSDGDNDVLSASAGDNKIAWYENLGGGTFGSQQVISMHVDGAFSVYACDLDGDGDNDVLSTSVDDNKIAWYENLGGGTFDNQQVISTLVLGAESVYACDLDGDGDNDVLSASYFDDKIAWYKNLGGGTFGGQQVISTQADGTHSVYACDLDGDADNDVLSASGVDNKIAWYKNSGLGTFGSQQVISTLAEGAMSVYACDLDGDGDNDVLSASRVDDKIAWYENLGGGTFGSQQVISTQADGANSIYACDLDGDGDNDVLSASSRDDKIAWYENLRPAGTGSPEIDVERDGTDDVHTHSFGTLDLGQSVSQEFTVHNEGNADLVVTQAAGLVSPFSISLVNNSSSTDDWVITAGGIQIFTVSFSPVNAGNYNDTLVLTSNDSDEGSFLIVFTSAATGTEIEVLGNSQVILDGDSTPNPSDHTDFGSIYTSSGSVSQTFTIRSVGSEALNLTGSPDRVVITGSGDFTVTQQPASPVAAYGGTTTFEITFDPSGYGINTATISIANNDENENPYDFVIQGTGLLFSTQQVIGMQADGAGTVYACDLDGDGDNDVLSASYFGDNIAWYENLGGSTFGGQQVISTQAWGVMSVYACDLDGDGDNDVLSASYYDHKVAWYENLGGGNFGDPADNQQVISTQAEGAQSVYACDLDGDGDNDVLSASWYDDKIAWYENRLNELTADFGSQQVISTQADGALSVYACDLDGDGDNDVLSASADDDKIAWYENLGGGAFGSEQVISPQTDSERSVYACDLDGDGDNDVLSASSFDDKIAWYENLGGGVFDTQQVISTQAEGAHSVFACDLDGDGDNDVLSASVYDDKVAWYDNLGGGTFGTQQVISTQAEWATSVYACDLDGDGDNDVLSASLDDDKVAWYENLRSAPGSPEIDVERNGTDNVHTHSFGTLDPGQSVSHEFTVRNEGDADLVVTQAGGLVTPFSISPVNNSGSIDDWVIPTGGTQTFTVSFSPVNAGDYSDTLVLTSNDSDEGSYQVIVQGTATVPSVDNVALGKAASQSSTWGPDIAIAERAVDGNTSGDWWADESIASTNLQTHPWWQVDLGEVYSEIIGIEIWNRTDLSQDRLDDFYVFVSDVPFVSGDLAATLAQSGVWSQHHVGVPDPKVMLPVGRSGRYVRIQLGDTNYLSLAEVKVFAPSTVPSVDNVALGQAASQSSTWGPDIATAGRAVDGNTSGDWWADESIASTNLETHPWWQVDLGEVYSEITGIEIWNRTDSVPERLDDFYVFVSDVPFVSGDLATTLAQSGVWSQHHVGVPDPKVMVPVGRSGRYVRIQLADTNYLSLAEVKVFAPATVPIGDNVALGKAASQSSTWGPDIATAGRAVDGNTSGDWWADESIASTNLETHPWWQVDLGEVYSEIIGIEIWNRTDSVEDRLDDFYVFVSDVPFVSGDLAATLAQSGVWSQHHVGVPDPKVMVPVGRSGRYVRIQLGDTNYLSLAEVKVFAPPTVPIGDNVALGKAASQSSTWGPDIATADRAVDGNTSGDWWADESIASTNLETHPWWQVDLGEVYSEIIGIEIWNRTDSVEDRLDDFYVFVSDVPFVSGDLAATLAQSGVWSYHHVGVPDPKVMLPVGLSGRYVRIQLSDTNYLTLAEVKVFAPATLPSGDNVALGKAASQSSTWGPDIATADRAVDGNTSGDWWANESIASTNLQTQPWWQVDLGEVYSEITGIEIWNRTDSVEDRLDDFYVFVSDVPFVSGDLAATLAQSGVWSYHHVGVPDPKVMLPVGLSGRYVRIQLSDTNYLTLAEVKVFATA